MKETTPKNLVIPIALSVLALGTTVGAFYYQHTQDVKTRLLLADTQSQLVDVRTTLQGKVDTLQASLDLLSSKSALIAQVLSQQEDKAASVAQVVGQVSQSVGTLEKLAKSDPELLKKYSKIYFLNEHYVPVSLTTIDPTDSISPSKVMQYHANAWPFMQKLFSAIASEVPSNTLKIDSAFRSFGAQAQLKKSYQFTYGAGTANQFSAEQGYSEHQLGTAVDFTTTKIGGTLSGFDKTAEYTWLTNNAYKYGFVLSYPPNNTYYEFEPWHWRFVGVALATELHNRGIHFYDMDQREIDTYLAGMFDN